MNPCDPKPRQSPIFVPRKTDEPVGAEIRDGFWPFKLDRVLRDIAKDHIDATTTAVTIYDDFAPGVFSMFAPAASSES